MSPSVGVSALDETVSKNASETYLHHKEPHNHNHRRRVSIASLKAPDSASLFAQVKSRHERTELELVDVWTTMIPAKIATTVVSQLKQKLPKDPHTLMHLRRLVKDDLPPRDESGVLLSLLICSVDAVPSEDDVRALLDPLSELVTTPTPDERLFVPTIKHAPAFAAPTKEQSKEWSEGTWPIMWRGNPHLIVSELPQEDEEELKGHLERLLDLTEEAHNAGEIPIATIITDPETRQVVASSIDTRNSSRNPLSHSVMSCIAKVAAAELARRNAVAEMSNSQEDASNQAYLCHNLQLITTHEPCAMCCMAMVHSRISRLVYVQNMPRSGGIDRNSGPGYGIHWNKHLNWRFEAWGWNFEDILMYDVDENINA
ncbi:cytidine deaminase-like protein [Myxozyma melibiosi]|uniref:Cytidine deaminase-like protein n=1 Tax=Myxozyma melibiosi TaxID=54550 RepID=A0ABR1F6K0_9ASCO